MAVRGHGTGGDTRRKRPNVIVSVVGSMAGESRLWSIPLWKRRGMEFDFSPRYRSIPRISRVCTGWSEFLQYIFFVLFLPTAFVLARPPYPRSPSSIRKSPRSCIERRWNTSLRKSGTTNFPLFARTYPRTSRATAVTDMKSHPRSLRLGLSFMQYPKGELGVIYSRSMLVAI